MDKKQLIGLLLIFGLIYLFTWYNKPPEDTLSQQGTQDTLILDQNKDLVKESVDIAPSTFKTAATDLDSMESYQLRMLYGDFYNVAIGEEQQYKIENERMRLTFSNRGGRITEVFLKKYKRVEEGDRHEEIKLDLFLMNNENSRFEYLLPVKNVKDGVISTADLFFEPQLSQDKVVFTATSSTGVVVEQVYELTDNPYKVDYTFNAENLGYLIDRNSSKIQLNWVEYLNKLEKNDQFEKTYSTLQYKAKDEGADYCSFNKDDTDDLTGQKLEWISNSNQFFSTVLMPKKGSYFEGGELSVKIAEEDYTPYLKETTAQVYIPLDDGNNESFEMEFYLGPNEYDRLKAFDNDLEETINFGRSVFGTLNRWVIRPIFLFFLNWTNSAGMAIVLLIFLVKTVLYPLTYKMLKSSAKMGVLKPEITQVKEKYKDDSQKSQMKTMELYRKFGVSPFGGCMPMILQMPIWFALFRFFPAAFEFRQKPFLWATDLSSYDALFHLPFDIPMFGGHLSLFALLWTISTLIYTYYNTQNMDMGTNPAMKYMQYFMPVIFIVFFNNYASGLTAYMFFSNLINILQTIVTKKFIFDDEKIRAELELKKDKPKKKNTFSKRLEEAMKQQQKTMDEKKKGGGKKK